MSHNIAQVSLDFHVVGSMCGGATREPRHGPTAVKFAICALMGEVRAHDAARAADACIEAGNSDKGVEAALNLEQPFCETTRLLDAASLINRVSRT